MWGTRDDLPRMQEIKRNRNSDIPFPLHWTSELTQPSDCTRPEAFPVALIGQYLDRILYNRKPCQPEMKTGLLGTNQLFSVRKAHPHRVADEPLRFIHLI